jgi:hypothetical protein
LIKTLIYQVSDRLGAIILPGLLMLSSHNQEHLLLLVPCSRAHVPKRVLYHPPVTWDTLSGAFLDHILIGSDSGLSPHRPSFRPLKFGAPY